MWLFVLGVEVELEEDLQGEFSIERFAGPDGGVAEIRSERGADCPDLASRWKPYGGKIGAVEEVVDVRPELSAHPFGNRCRLDGGEVEGTIAGIVVLSAARWGVGSGRGIDEGSGIEPLDRAVDDGVGDAGLRVGDDLYGPI